MMRLLFPVCLGSSLVSFIGELFKQDENRLISTWKHLKFSEGHIFVMQGSMRSLICHNGTKYTFYLPERWTDQKTMELCLVLVGNNERRIQIAQTLFDESDETDFGFSFVELPQDSHETGEEDGSGEDGFVVIETDDSRLKQIRCASFEASLNFDSDGFCELTSFTYTPAQSSHRWAYQSTSLEAKRFELDKESPSICKELAEIMQNQIDLATALTLISDKIID
jgi:hypothetical protein